MALSCGLVPNRDSLSPFLCLVSRELRAGIVVASGKSSGHCRCTQGPEVAACWYHCSVCTRKAGRASLERE